MLEVSAFRADGGGAYKLSVPGIEFEIKVRCEKADKRFCFCCAKVSRIEGVSVEQLYEFVHNMPKMIMMLAEAEERIKSTNLDVKLEVLN